MTRDLSLRIETHTVQPIPEKGHKMKAFNYRPVAIVTAITKVLETMIKSEIFKYLQQHSLIHSR